MIEYEDGRVAQSCKYFSTEAAAKKRVRTGSDGVSCSECGNWNGTRCFAGASRSVFTGLDREMYD